MSNPIFELEICKILYLHLRFAKSYIWTWDLQNPIFALEICKLLYLRLRFAKFCICTRDLQNRVFALEIWKILYLRLRFAKFCICAWDLQNPVFALEICKKVASSCAVGPNDTMKKTEKVYFTRKWIDWLMKGRRTEILSVSFRNVSIINILLLYCAVDAITWLQLKNLMRYIGSRQLIY